MGNPAQQSAGAPASVAQLSETLANSEAHNRAVLEAAVDSILSIDEKGLIQSANPATIKTFGYKMEELLGRNISMLMPDPFRSEHDQYLLRYLNSGEKRIIGIGREVLGQRKDGSIFPIELSVSEVQMPGKKYFTGIVRDITDRKQVEEALLLERNRIQQYLDVAAVVLISLDMEGHVQLINRTATTLLGFSEAEVLGKRLQEILPNEQTFLLGLSEALTSNTGASWESSLQTSKAMRVLTWHSSPLSGRDGAVSGLLISGADVTERVRAQASLLEAHSRLEDRVQHRTEELHRTNIELRDSLKEKEVLLKEIHHRVKNNLQLISSLLNLQVRRRKNLTVDELVTEIQGRIQSIALLHEMLYQSGDLVHVDFVKYVETLGQTIVRYFGLNSRVNLKIDADNVALSLDGSIYCGLLLNELITNAMKHAFPGQRSGELTVTMRRMPDGRVSLSVVDNGVGLPANFDIKNIRSLGLELVQQLTTKLHGQLKITDEGGAGFWLEFQDGG